MRSHSPRPNRIHSQPMTTATTSEAPNRATAIIGWFGKATNVDTITTGLIAGLESRNASAAAGATPRAIIPPATGTDAHSQPGSTTPAAPATGTARAGREGSALAKNDAGT